MSITPIAKIWMNGDLIDWDAARVNVLTHTLHYGTGVYEGLRAYETPEGPAVFRLIRPPRPTSRVCLHHDDEAALQRG